MAVAGGGREEDDTFVNPGGEDGLIAFGTQEKFMRTASMTVETEPMEFPEGTVGGKWRIGVSGTVVEAQSVDVPTARFVLPAGDYVGSAQRLNSGGSDIGPPATAAFTVTDIVAVVTIDVAKSLTVTVE